MLRARHRLALAGSARQKLVKSTGGIVVRTRFARSFASRMPRIYLDNAATSWPKPEAVWRAMDDYQRRLGAPAGRGTYQEAAEVERLIRQCRQRLAELVGVEQPERMILTFNGTDSLNLAL